MFLAERLPIRYGPAPTPAHTKATAPLYHRKAARTKSDCPQSLPLKRHHLSRSLYKIFANPFSQRSRQIRLNLPKVKVKLESTLRRRLPKVSLCQINDLLTAKKRTTPPLLPLPAPPRSTIPTSRARKNLPKKNNLLCTKRI